MPIAKLISADGSIEIYYELHGRHSTTRDDMSYSKAANESSWAGKRSSSIKEAGRKDPALARTLHAVDSAVGAQQVIDRGKEEADGGRLHSGPSDAVPVPRRFLHSAAGSQIELADMSGRSSPACQGMRDSPSASASQASEAGLARKQSSGPAPDHPTAEEVSAGPLKETARNSREAPDVNGSIGNAGSHSAVPNGNAGDTYVVTMPHEDLETSTSRWLHVHPAASHAAVAVLRITSGLSADVECAVMSLCRCVMVCHMQCAQSPDTPRRPVLYLSLTLQCLMGFQPDRLHQQLPLLQQNKPCHLSGAVQQSTAGWAAAFEQPLPRAEAWKRSIPGCAATSCSSAGCRPGAARSSTSPSRSTCAASPTTQTPAGSCSRA